MITFLELGQYGRLGNQLFQYCALKSLSIHKGYGIKLPKNLFDRYWHGQKCLLSKFNIKFEYLNHDDFLNLKTYDHSHFTTPQGFDPRFFDLDDNTNLMGHFQNLKYFESYFDIIKEDLIIDSGIQKYCDQYLNDNFKLLNKPIVSVHIRKGDNPANCEVIDNFIQRAINYFNSEVNFLFFTGGSRDLGENNSLDIQDLKNNYKSSNFYFSETNNPIVDFCLMSKCDHNIVSHDSTFSWWSAYLNSSKHRKVISPKNPRSLDSNLIFDNFYPQDWILL